MQGDTHYWLTSIGKVNALLDAAAQLLLQGCHVGRFQLIQTSNGQKLLQQCMHVTNGHIAKHADVYWLAVKQFRHKPAPFVLLLHSQLGDGSCWRLAKSTFALSDSECNVHAL